MAVLKLAFLAAGASAFVAPAPKLGMTALKADAVVEEEAAPAPAEPAAAAPTFGKMLGDEQFDYSSIVGGASPASRPAARENASERLLFSPVRSLTRAPPPSAQPRAAWARPTRSTR